MMTRFIRVWISNLFLVLVASWFMATIVRADDGHRARAERAAAQILNGTEAIRQYYAHPSRDAENFLPPALVPPRARMGQWMASSSATSAGSPSVQIIGDRRLPDDLQGRGVHYDLPEADQEIFARLLEQLKKTPGIDLRHRLIVAADLGFLMGQLVVMRNAAVELHRIQHHTDVSDVIADLLHRLHNDTHGARGGFFLTMRDVGPLSWLFKRARATVPAYPAEPIACCVDTPTNVLANSGFLNESDPRWIGLVSAPIARNTRFAVEGFYNGDLLSAVNNVSKALNAIDSRGEWPVVDTNFQPSSGLVYLRRRLYLGLVGDLAAPRWSEAPSPRHASSLEEDDVLAGLVHRVLRRSIVASAKQTLGGTDAVGSQNMTYIAISLINSLRTGLPALDILSLYFDRALRALEVTNLSIRAARKCNTALGD